MLWICSQMNATEVTEPHWREVNIGSDDGLVQHHIRHTMSYVVFLSAIRQQTITWANTDPDLCRHMVSLSQNELNGIQMV